MVIQTIRNKLGPIIVIVIGLALAVFVLETALNSNVNLMRGNSNVVGVIDGEKIEITDFSQRVEEAENNYRLQTSQVNIDENTMNSLRDQAWNQMVNDRLNETEYNKLGLIVSTEELKSMLFGPDAVPEIKQAPAFTNPQTGEFDPSLVKYYYDRLDETGPNEREGERRLRWVAFEKAQKEQRLSNKYSALIKNSLYVPKWMAEVDYNEKNTQASINFVTVPYTTINDSAVAITDADLQKYLDEHKAQFKQEESRKLEYVVFKVVPSDEDSAVVLKEINTIHQHIVANPSDTDYIKLNADKGLDKFYYKEDNMASAAISDTLLTAPVGTVYGPYFEDDAYKVAVLKDRKVVPDSVKARHILIRAETPADTLKARTKIDSIKNAVLAGTPFDSLARRFSQDQGSAERGGELGFYAQGASVKNFNHYLFFEGKKGDMKVIKTEFGYHLTRIDSILNPSLAAQVDLISRPLRVSSETDKIMYERATRLASENPKQEEFLKTAEEQKLNKMMAPSVNKNAYQLPGLTQAREIVKWAYQAKPGEVSAPFSIENNIVVAVVTAVKEEGTATIEDVRPQLEMQVRKQKKAEQISSQLDAAMALNTTIDAIATKVSQPMKSSSNVAFANAYAENLGYEPKVVGTVFAMKENQVSRPINGEQGVIVLQVQSFTQPQPIADYNQFKQQLLSSIQPRLQYGLTDALKKSVKIEDNRFLFF